jgi:PAT family acetyl-CoA transporter-like MFS transporter 1
MEKHEEDEENPKDVKGIPENSPLPNYRKDIKSILTLFGLYILQGIPLGLIVTVPFLLQAKGVPYKDQAIFSLAFWPFSLKVLYAPIIDAIYWKRYFN